LFLSWVVNFLKSLSPLVGQVGFPVDKYQELSAARDDFALKLKTAVEPSTRTPVAVRAKNDARALLERCTRKAVAEYLANNHLLDDPGRVSLGLPPRKTTRSPAPTPTTAPGFSINPLAGRRLEARFHARGKEGERRQAKPFGVHGAEIAWAILDAPPASHVDLVHSTFGTRSPYIFQFDFPDAGKRLYCCLRWENTRGEKGPWSEIQSAIIP
jgi:hypothetical protein